MPAHPLTHHEILPLVAPFSRRDRHLDLAASDRLQRRLVFKCVERSGAEPGLPALRERLQLDNAEPSTFRLTRVLAHPDGMTATLQIEGADPEQLLQSVDAISPQLQFRAGPGYAIALDYRLGPAADAVRGTAAAASLILTQATAMLAGLALSLQAPAVKGEPAVINLAAGAEFSYLPPDVLAVLGWDWSPLRPSDDGWRGSLRARGREPVRSRSIERRFEQAVLHLAQTLAQPPERFHDSWVRSRWRVYFQSGIPVLTCSGLIVAVAVLPRAHLAEHSALRMLIFNAPPLLMGLFFCLREIPRIVIPPIPRRSQAAAWSSVAADTALDAGPHSAC
jgi:hypothetical protein